MASIRDTNTTNKELFDTIRDLKKLSNSTGVGVYRAVAAKLAAPASQRSAVNLSKIDRNTKDGETVVVPGKVLGSGSLSKKVTIVGFSASQTAIEGIERAGSKFVTIKDYVSKKHDPKMRIIG